MNDNLKQLNENAKIHKTSGTVLEGTNFIELLTERMETILHDRILSVPDGPVFLYNDVAHAAKVRQFRVRYNISESDIVDMEFVNACALELCEEFKTELGDKSFHPYVMVFVKNIIDTATFQPCFVFSTRYAEEIV